MSADLLHEAAKVLRHDIEFGSGGVPAYGAALADLLYDEAERAQEITETLPPGSKQLPSVLRRNVTGYGPALEIARQILDGAS